jgi:hypothetical protein
MLDEHDLQQVSDNGRTVYISLPESVVAFGEMRIGLQRSRTTARVFFVIACCRLAGLTRTGEERCWPILGMHVHVFLGGLGLI